VWYSWLNKGTAASWTCSVDIGTVSPGIPCWPCDPVCPCGIVKFNIALLKDPTLDTAAGVPGATVATVPTWIVPEFPCEPISTDNKW
jgi:hypothetical protein